MWGRLSIARRYTSHKWNHIPEFDLERVGLLEALSLMGELVSTSDTIGGEQAGLIAELIRSAICSCDWTDHDSDCLIACVFLDASL